VDVLETIREDHQQVLRELDEVKNTSTRTTGKRDKPWDTLVRNLLRHMYAEETVFYPALEGKNRDKILEAIEEHKLVRGLMKQMDEMPKDDDVWTAKLKVMTENLMHHIHEEEGPIFKAAKDEFGVEQLQDLGRRFEEAKESAPR
jgi:hemerythrin-like domain-containing protein